MWGVKRQHKYEYVVLSPLQSRRRRQRTSTLMQARRVALWPTNPYVPCWLWIVSGMCRSTGFALALIVTVDSENKTRIVGQALLRNERTDSFEFVLNHYTRLRHGLPPLVSGVLRCCG